MYTQSHLQKFSLEARGPRREGGPMTSLFPKKYRFRHWHEAGRGGVFKFSVLKVQTENNFSGSRLGVNGPCVSVCQLTSQNFKMLHCCILPLFAETPEAGRCVSLFFNWKWRMAGKKKTHKKTKKTSLSRDLSEALRPASQACWFRSAAKLLIQSPEATLQGILGATSPHFPRRCRENKRQNAGKIGQSAAGWLYLPLRPQSSEWKNSSGAMNSSFSRSSLLPPVNLGLLCLWQLSCSARSTEEKLRLVPPRWDRPQGIPASSARTQAHTPTELHQQM